MDEELLADLRSLWEKNYIERAVRLNEQLGVRYFHENTLPMYFTGNRTASTVMVMLNPGGYNPAYDFATNNQVCSNFDRFVSGYIHARINYGEEDKSRIDNFDLKQAAFLYAYNDPELQIPSEFWNSTETKLLAKRNVLMNKSQLELIPYVSRSFGGLLDSVQQAQRNFKAFEPFLSSLVTEIFSAPRKHLFFCSKQFFNLFTAANDFGGWNNVFNLYPPLRYKEGNLTLSCTNVTISFEGNALSATIANSFPSQALPNAFTKMVRYGKFCSNQLFT